MGPGFESQRDHKRKANLTISFSYLRISGFERGASWGPIPHKESNTTLFPQNYFDFQLSLFYNGIQKQMMKKKLTYLLMSSSFFLLTGCSVIEGIFKAGVWTGILIVVVVVALVIWLISKLFGGSK